MQQQENQATTLLEGLLVKLTGFSRDDRLALRTRIERNGGLVTDDLLETTTHVIVCDRSTDTCLKAWEVNRSGVTGKRPIQVVSPDFLENFLAYRQRMADEPEEAGEDILLGKRAFPTERYAVRPLRGFVVGYTGFDGGSSQQVETRVRALGGVCKRELDSSVNFLLVPSLSYGGYQPQSASNTAAGLYSAPTSAKQSLLLSGGGGGVGGGHADATATAGGGAGAGDGNNNNTMTMTGADFFAGYNNNNRDGLATATAGGGGGQSLSMGMQPSLPGGTAVALSNVAMNMNVGGGTANTAAMLHQQQQLSLFPPNFDASNILNNSSMMSSFVQQQQPGLGGGALGMLQANATATSNTANTNNMQNQRPPVGPGASAASGGGGGGGSGVTQAPRRLNVQKLVFARNRLPVVYCETFFSLLESYACLAETAAARSQVEDLGRLIETERRYQQQQQQQKMSAGSDAVILTSREDDDCSRDGGEVLMAGTQHGRESSQSMMMPPPHFAAAGAENSNSNAHRARSMSPVDGSHSSAAPAAAAAASSGSGSNTMTLVPLPPVPQHVIETLEGNVVCVVFATEQQVRDLVWFLAPLGVAVVTTPPNENACTLLIGPELERSHLDSMRANFQQRWGFPDCVQSAFALQLWTRAVSETVAAMATLAREKEQREEMLQNNFDYEEEDDNAEEERYVDESSKMQEKLTALFGTTARGVDSLFSSAAGSDPTQQQQQQQQSLDGEVATKMSHASRTSSNKLENKVSYSAWLEMQQRRAKHLLQQKRNQSSAAALQAQQQQQQQKAGGSFDMASMVSRILSRENSSQQQKESQQAHQHFLQQHRASALSAVAGPARSSSSNISNQKQQQQQQQQQARPSGAAVATIIQVSRREGTDKIFLGHFFVRDPSMGDDCLNISRSCVKSGGGMWVDGADELRRQLQQQALLNASSGRLSPSAKFFFVVAHDKQKQKAAATTLSSSSMELLDRSTRHQTGLQDVTLEWLIHCLGRGKFVEPQSCFAFYLPVCRPKHTVRKSLHSVAAAAAASDTSASRNSSSTAGLPVRSSSNALLGDTVSMHHGRVIVVAPRCGASTHLAEAYESFVKLLGGSAVNTSKISPNAQLSQRGVTHIIYPGNKWASGLVSSSSSSALMSVKTSAANSVLTSPKQNPGNSSSSVFPPPPQQPTFNIGGGAGGTTTASGLGISSPLRRNRDVDENSSQRERGDNTQQQQQQQQQQPSPVEVVAENIEWFSSAIRFIFDDQQQLRTPGLSSLFVVTPAWLEESAKNGFFVAESPYVVPNPQMDLLGSSSALGGGGSSKNLGEIDAVDQVAQQNSSSVMTGAAATGAGSNNGNANAKKQLPSVTSFMASQGLTSDTVAIKLHQSAVRLTNTDMTSLTQQELIAQQQMEKHYESHKNSSSGSGKSTAALSTFLGSMMQPPAPAPAAAAAANNSFQIPKPQLQQQQQQQQSEQPTFHALPPSQEEEPPSMIYRENNNNNQNNESNTSQFGEATQQQMGNLITAALAPVRRGQQRRDETCRMDDDDANSRANNNAATTASGMMVESQRAAGKELMRRDELLPAAAAAADHKQQKRQQSGAVSKLARDEESNRADDDDDDDDDDDTSSASSHEVDDDHDAESAATNLSQAADLQTTQQPCAADDAARKEESKSNGAAAAAAAEVANNTDKEQRRGFFDEFEDGSDNGSAKVSAAVAEMVALRKSARASISRGSALLVRDSVHGRRSAAGYNLEHNDFPHNMDEFLPAAMSQQQQRQPQQEQPMADPQKKLFFGEKKDESAAAAAAVARGNQNGDGIIAGIVEQQQPQHQRDLLGMLAQQQSNAQRLEDADFEACRVFCSFGSQQAEKDKEALVAALQECRACLALTGSAAHGSGAAANNNNINEDDEGPECIDARMFLVNDAEYADILITDSVAELRTSFLVALSGRRWICGPDLIQRLVDVESMRKQIKLQQQERQQQQQQQRGRKGKSAAAAATKKMAIEAVAPPDYSAIPKIFLQDFEWSEARVAQLPLPGAAAAKRAAKARARHYAAACRSWREAEVPPFSGVGVAFWLDCTGTVQAREEALQRQESFATIVHAGGGLVFGEDIAGAVNDDDCTGGGGCGGGALTSMREVEAVLRSSPKITHLVVSRAVAKSDTSISTLRTACLAVGMQKKNKGGGVVGSTPMTRAVAVVEESWISKLLTREATNDTLGTLTITAMSE